MSFTAHVVEQMSFLGPVQAKKMFGGWGIFRMDLMFAVVIGDELYFKADEQNVGQFLARGATENVISKLLRAPPSGAPGFP
jgi:DNA transformation protein